MHLLIQSCSVITTSGHQNKDSLCDISKQTHDIDKKIALTIANTFDMQGDKHFLATDHPKASVCYKNSFKIRTQAFGPRHISLLQSLYNLATNQEAKEEYNKAERSYQKSLNILKNKSQPQPAKLNEFLGYFAAIHYQKNTKNREKNLQSLLKVFIQLHDPHNIRVGAINHRLAIIFLKRNDLQESEKAFINALSIIKQHTGITHPYYAKILKDYSKLLYSRNKIKQAEKLQHLAEKILKKFPKKLHTKLYSE